MEDFPYVLDGLGTCPWRVWTACVDVPDQLCVGVPSLNCVRCTSGAAPGCIAAVATSTAAVIADKTPLTEANAEVVADFFAVEREL